MSGPKGVSYQVVSAEELARRERDRARARLLAKLRDIEVLRAQAGDVAARVPGSTGLGLGRADDLAAIQEKLERAATYATRLRAAMDSARTEAAVGALRSAAVQVRISGLDTKRRAPRERGDQATSGTTGPESSVTRLDRAIERLAALEEPTRERLQHLLTTCVQIVADPADGRGDQMVSHLETQVTLALRAQRAQREWGRRRSELAEEYAELGPFVDDLLDQGHRASTTAGLTELRRRLDEERTARAVAEDRAFVLEQARSALTDLGYTVDTPVNSEQRVIVQARDPNWPNHALQLVLPSNQQSLRTHAIAFGQTDARDDTNFEAESCRDVEELWTRLRAAGITTLVEHRRPAGAVVVRRHSADTGRTSGRTVKRERTVEP